MRPYPIRAHRHSLNSGFPMLVLGELRPAGVIPLPRRRTQVATQGARCGSHLRGRQVQTATTRGDSRFKGLETRAGTCLARPTRRECGGMSRNRILTITLACGLVILGVEARAQQPSDSGQGQEHGSVGLTLAYPATGVSGGLIGLICRRPTGSRETRGFHFCPDRWRFDHHRAGPVMVAWDRADAALLRRAQRGSRGVRGSPLLVLGGTVERRWRRYANRQLWGWRQRWPPYLFTKKIDVFGEVGLGYQFSTYSSTSSGGTYSEHSTSHGIGSRTALGLNLYF